MPYIFQTFLKSPQKPVLTFCLNFAPFLLTDSFFFLGQLAPTQLFSYSLRFPVSGAKVFVKSAPKY